MKIAAVEPGGRLFSRQMRAPTSAPLAGRRKLEEAIEPVAVRGPVITDGSVLTSVHVPPRSQELPLPLDEPRETCVRLATARLRVSWEWESAKSKPVPPLRQAVSWSTRIALGLPLSMKPPTALSNAIELRTKWAGCVSATPPPIFQPLPSPVKFGRFHRLKPLPQATELSMVIGERNFKASKPSSELFHSRAPRTTLPEPEPSLMARPSALSPFLRGSWLPKLSRLSTWLLLEADWICRPDS